MKQTLLTESVENQSLKLDEDWIALMIEAKNLGMTVEQVQSFLDHGEV